MTVLNNETRIYVAGHRGMVGAAICRELSRQGFENIVTRTHAELDLRDQAAVRDFMRHVRPDYVVLAAAKVGGIHANNTYPADFIYDNLQMQANVIHEGFTSGVRNLLFLGSSCIYPKLAEQPMREESLLTGPLECTNEPYAIAKIAGIKLCESYNRQHDTDFRSVMPTNLYGPNDNFHPMNSHVIPALIRRFHEAKEQGAGTVEVWGTGTVRREFLYVDDMARACVHVMDLAPEIYRKHTKPMLSHINIGTGEDVTIKELAETIADVVGYQGDIAWNTEMPDGTPRKLLSVDRLKGLGWSARVGLSDGLKSTYDWFCQHVDEVRG